jgi:hypothetical protein
MRILRSLFERYAARKVWGSDYFLVQVRYNRNMTPEEGAAKLEAFREWKRKHPNSPASEYHDKSDDFLGDNPFPPILQKLYGLRFDYDRENHFYFRMIPAEDGEVDKAVDFCERIRQIFEEVEFIGLLRKALRVTWRPGILLGLLLLSDKQLDELNEVCNKNVNVHAADGASLMHSDLKQDLGIIDLGARQ